MKKIKLPTELIDLISQNEETLSKKVVGAVEKKEANSSSEQYKINDEDTVLVHIVKENINEKNINIKELEFTNQRELNNYKRSLIKHNTMSISKFAHWMDLMKVPWLIIYGDQVKEYQEWLKQKRAKEKGEK